MSIVVIGIIVGGAVFADDPQQALTREQQALQRRLIIAEHALEPMGELHPSRKRLEEFIQSLRAELETATNGDGAVPDPPPSPKLPAAPTPTSKSAPEQKPTTQMVENRPKGPEIFTPSQLKMIGGYRIPEAWFEGKSMSFSNGGLTGRHEGKGQLRLWMAHHAQNTAVAEFIAPTERGTDMIPNRGPNWTYAPIAKWPIAKVVRIIPGAYAELRALDGAEQVHAVHWSDELNRLLVSGRSWYNTTAGKDAWLVPVDVSQDPPVVEPALTPGLPQQPFGGGFVDIPDAFAEAYCGGNRLGLAKGGYESGQGSATSPTLAAYGKAPVKVLQWSKWNSPKEQHERRDTNYDGSGVGWQPLAENGIGYWGVDRVMDAAWIHTDAVSALISIVLQPTGKVDYELQGAVFSHTTQYRLYVYDPADLARVAQGELQEYEVRGRWYELPQVPLGQPFGLWWDTHRKLLSIVYTAGWSNGGSESYPVVIEYEVMEKAVK